MTDAPAPQNPFLGSADVIVAVVLAFAAAFGVAFPAASVVVRVLVAAPLVLVVPGYLLLQAALVPARPARRRLAHALIALGLSPGILGLAALATALSPGGFRPVPIVLSVTVVCLGLAAVALVRRAHHPVSAREPAPRPGAPAPRPAPIASTAPPRVPGPRGQAR